MQSIKAYQAQSQSQHGNKEIKIEEPEEDTSGEDEGEGCDGQVSPCFGPVRIERTGELVDHLGVLEVCHG